MQESAKQMIARLSAMNPAQLAAEKLRLTAQHDAQDVARFGYALNAHRQGREPVMDEYTRMDSAPVSKLKAHTVKDQSGRPITHYSGEPGAIRQWTQDFRGPVFEQLAIYNGCDPKDFAAIVEQAKQAKGYA